VCEHRLIPPRHLTVANGRRKWAALKRILVTICILSVLLGAGNAFAAPFYTDTSKQAVFISPLEGWTPTWNIAAYVSPLERAGYHVDILLDGNVTVSFLETELAKYDVIVLRADSFEYEGQSYYCTGEPVNFKTRATFTSETSSGELRMEACLGFSVQFIQNHYPRGSLRHGLVLAVGSTTAELSYAFLNAGAAAFIGYYEEYSLQWGRLDSFSQKFLNYLSLGYTTKEASMQLQLYVYHGHGQSADWPDLYLSGDANCKI
jgi:hypothetical protein